VGGWIIVGSRGALYDPPELIGWHLGCDHNYHQWLLYADWIILTAPTPRSAMGHDRQAWIEHMSSASRPKADISP
jgi:hypothetical protein